MLNSFITLLKTPKTQIGFLLTLIFITAFFNNPSLKVILVFALSVGGALIFDLLFLKIRGVKPFFPSSALVTGSIVGLLTAPDLTWYAPVVGIIAMFSKNFIRFSNRHIFNPAGFGLLVGGIIFRDTISWWAVSWQQFSPAKGGIEFIVYFLILLSPSLISSYRMGRYRITLSFLLTYSVLIFLLNTKYLILNTILDPTILFFSIVMLIEPLTSPNNHIKQILFGVFVALLAIFLSSAVLNPASPAGGSKFLILNSLDPLIFSLLLGNLVFFKLR